jgi:K+-transporting ATPase ATPase A chain
MLLVALFTIFVTSLMIGRTPSYMGKTLGARETRFIVIYMLVAPIGVLIPTAVSVVTSSGLAGLTTNTGIHGFSEILYVYASAFGNNGQNFAGLSANSPFYNVAIGAAMMLGRFALGITALALAGQFAERAPRPAADSHNVPTDSLLFGSLLVATAVIVGVVTFLPALALGPFAEHFTGMPLPR